MDDDLDAPLRRPTYDELLKENAQLKVRVAVLERRVEELTRLVEKLRGEGKRQAAPFRKQDEPAAEPKKPGRKSGRRHGPHAHRSPPPRIDETYRAPLPKTCPHCGGRRLKKTEIVPQYQTEIPRQVIYRRFDVQHGLCRTCGRAVAGRHAWLHDFVSRRSTCYVIDPTRSGQPAEQLLGRDWAGTLIHDGWSIYDRFTAAAHQQCLAHLARRCRGLLETARGAAARLPRGVLALIEQAYSQRRLWRGHRLDRDRLADAGLTLSYRLDELASGKFRSTANRRLAAHLRARAMSWFWFLIDPAIDATNYRAEQALRPAVVNRKVWGGNRTWAGAQAQAILMSVLRTCAQRLAPTFTFLVTALCSPRPAPLPT